MARRKKEPTTTRFRRARRWLSLLLVGAVVLAASIFVAGEVYRRGDHRGALERWRGALVSSEEASLGVEDGFETTLVTLRDDLGLTVRGHLKAAVGTEGPQPALILLGGVETGRETVEHVEDSFGATLFALDYPYEGKISHLGTGEFLRALPAMRRALICTVPAVSLAVDYLETRPDVDPQRIVLIGGSIGALLAPAAAASEPRLAAVGLLFGAGDLGGVARCNLGQLGPLAGPAAWLAAVLTAPLEPLEYVGEIAPRPLFFLNGTGDERMPVRFAEALHEAAGEPKHVHWIDAGHLHVDTTEFRDEVRTVLADWLVRHDLVSREALEASRRR